MMQALRGAMMAIAKGEVMETVTCDTTCVTSGEVYAWSQTLGETLDNVILVRKSPITEGRFSVVSMFVPKIGASSTNCFRMNGVNQVSLGTVGSGRTESLKIDSGTVFYVFRFTY